MLDKIGKVWYNTLTKPTVLFMKGAKLMALTVKNKNTDNGDGRYHVYQGKSEEWAIWRTYAQNPNIVILRRTNGEIATGHMDQKVKFKEEPNKIVNVYDLPVKP